MKSENKLIDTYNSATILDGATKAPSHGMHGSAIAESEERLMRVTEMGCRSLSILHLSDLHISGSILSEKYYRLIDDIKKMQANLKNVVLVVTGDIASHGRVKESQDAILDFFQELKIVLGDKVIDVELVPGNHDIDRAYLLSTDGYEVALREYLSLANRIVSIFGVKHSFVNSYGASVVDCGGRSVCFLRTDTSWFFEGRQFDAFVQSHFAKVQMDKSEIETKLQLLRDSKNARIREYIFKQIADLSDEINVKKARARKHGSPVEIIIALAHHPLSWLMKSKREGYVDFLGNYSAPDIDVWVCGHAHNVKIHYDNDDNQSMLVLMSGVGSEEHRRSMHRYSIYRLSMTRNVCSVQVRASFTKGEYKDDETLFPTETSYATGHFCYPLKAYSPGSIILLNTYDSNPRMEFYADQHALSMMQRLMDKMMALGLKLMNTTRVQQTLHKRRRGEICAGELMSMFLSRVCDDVVAAFVLQTVDKDTFSTMPMFDADADIDNIRWRAHFRSLMIKGKKYGDDVFRCIARSGGKVPWHGTEEKAGIHDVSWNSLIMGAFSHPRKMLIRSVNDRPKSRGTSWNDYMTTILNIEGNAIGHGKNTRPILTFAISSKSDNYESSVVACRFLYLLEFFNINKIISLCIEEYMRKMGFTPSDLLK